jgi:hypothetical protein
VGWHEPYDEPGSPLDRRLRCVQRQVSTWFEQRRPDQQRALSVCAGQGRDLLEVMAGRDDVADVSAALVELDPANAATARRLAGASVAAASRSSRRMRGGWRRTTVGCRPTWC